MKEFSELYRLYSERIYKYLLYLTCNKYDAEELLQETFFQAFKSISRFKGESSISTWLFSIARNVYLKKYNGDRKRNETSLEFGNIIDKNENWARVTFYRGKVKLGKELGL